MGHIQYYMQFSHLPYPFRNGASPAFQEAVGDALALPVTTPKHLHCIMGFDTGTQFDCNSAAKLPVSEADINHLYHRCLSTVPFLAFALSIEEWRWELFSGQMSPNDYNKRWWEIRTKNQGFIPEFNRSSKAFDPAAKYHIVDGDGYIRYFFSMILQFQFYQGMCEKAGEYDPSDPNTKPLYQCDYSGNIKAGHQLAEMMKLGASKPWPDALQIITGSRLLSINPLLNYFRPLFQKINADLKARGEKPCFGTSCQ